MFLNTSLRAGLWLSSLGLWVTMASAGPSVHEVQMGVDAWHIEHTPDLPQRTRQALMPDADTRWQYRPVSPWYTIESRLRHDDKGEFVLRGQAQAASGAKLNQLSYDMFVSPRLGLRAGVLDYRATWCRTHDLDNPWVREADPFCAHKVVRLPTDSAPALQIYVNHATPRYIVQGMLGSYHPLAFNFAPDEFSDLILSPIAKVTHNHKVVASINVLEPHSATEWRLSWVGTRQSFFTPDAYPNSGETVALNYHHKGDLWFAGVSWQVTPKLRSRLTHMTSDVMGRCELITPQDQPPCIQSYHKTSTVAELNYIVDSRNTWSIATTHYPREQFYWVPTKTSLFQLTHRSWSMAWRTDWSPNTYTVLQILWADYHRPYRKYDPPGQDGLQKGRATAVGFRWAYRL